MKTKKVWFVTGASKGLGLSLVQKLLAAGYRVAATSRTVAGLEEKIGKASNEFLPLEMNITDNEDVKKVIAKTVAHFGQLDVVVNNAGYGLIGSLEELSDAEVKEQFDVNVFGSLNVIRNAAPYLRAQQSGHFFNIASIGGYTGGFPGFGIYCATKFAVAGFTEALAEEMKDFGVHATVVYPGYFRTEFLSGGSIKVPANPIDAYKSTRAGEELHLNEINGKQSGDPDKAADVMIEVSEMQAPPVHLFLGQDAHDVARQKIGIIQTDLNKHEALAAATAFAEN
ncbi:SDR family oxidoreductase [Pseudoflavitalea sp. G-6-1-2]|uniref:SDR family oxidoreductase n=1 Tax=Pseudoflavitalea sp. G-6-1-2 TaxID=2728841 RepID=UPI00146A5E31|nr:SDR family oxidoreductase [Pseudoflavitalea sp. G-6-1-2]NML19536.1 SDR family oxidoreductase [Pseudoflavitalea sp. G-6-1-2]